MRTRSVAGLIPVSMVDWEGKLAAIIFLSGCNLRCPYCHNPELIKKTGVSALPWEKVVEQLREKDGWVDGVVITGGEPTVSEDLKAIVADLRDLKMPIKLDTNGTRPAVLKGLVEQSVLDFLAMDIKTSFSAYDSVTRVKGQADKVRESIDLVLAGGLDHEFRTTVVPGFVETQAVLEIARYLAERGAKRYFLQQFNPKIVLEPSLETIKPFPPAYIADLALRCSEFLPTKARGVS